MTFELFRRAPQQHTAALILGFAATALLGLAGCEDKVTAPIETATANNGAAGSGMTGTHADAGTAGVDAGQTGPTGMIEVLADDQADVLGAATAAFRGDNIWFTNFQIGQLFSATPAPVTPFSIRSVPLAGGAVSDTQITLPENYYPEGVTADDDGVLYIGSTTTGVIYRAAADSTEASQFMAAGIAERGVIGLTVDEARELLWFCDSSPTNQTGGALVGISLADGTETVRHTLPDTLSPVEVAAAANAAAVAADAGVADPVDAAAAPIVTYPFCNDVIVDSNGRLLFTESAGGTIYTIAPADALTANSATVWLDAPEVGNPAGFGANGLDIVGDMLVVANGDLVLIDLTSATPSENIQTVSLSNADGTPATLCGADGLATVPGSSTQIIVVENGFCDAAISRVIKVTLALD